MNQQNIIELLYEANQKGISLVLIEDKLKIRVEKGIIPDPGLVAKIKSNRENLIDYLVLQRKKPENELMPIVPIGRKENREIEASFQQQRLIFLDQLGGTANYHEYVVFKVKGELDCYVLNQALKAVISRHEALRTVLKKTGHKVIQTIKDVSTFETSITQDVTEIEAFVQQVVAKPFDLENDFMVRAQVFYAVENECYVCFVIHHIAGDGWSLPVFFKDLAQYYQVETIEDLLPPLPIQYSDYSHWQKENLAGDLLETKLSFWENHLDGVEPISLPVDHPRTQEPTGKGNSHIFQIGKSNFSKLKKLSKSSQSTLFTTLLSIYQVFLYKYTDQINFSVGTPVANRGQKELEQLIGFFTNTLALHVPIDSDDTFLQHLQKAKSLIVEAFVHQDAPFEQVVQRVAGKREQHVSPLFQTMFILNEYAPGITYFLDDLELSTVPIDYNVSRFDLSFELTILESENLQIRIEYASDLFESQTILRMADHFVSLFQRVIDAPNASIRSYELITAQEKKQLLQEFNNTSKVFGRSTIVELLSKQVQANPGNTAILFEETRITYKELDILSNRIANVFLENGIQNGDIVPVILERSVEMLAIILGLWKTGAAYVPIDPMMSSNRVTLILEDVNSKCVIVQDSLLGLTKSHRLRSLRLEDIMRFVSNKSDVTVEQQASQENLAYIIYTSGTTGKPKGVLIDHQALFNSIKSQCHALQIDKEYQMLGLANYSFDISVFEFFSPLSVGGTLILANKVETTDLVALKELISRTVPTHMESTPSFWKLLVQSGWTNRERLEIIWGGEPLGEQLRSQLIDRSPNQLIWTMYGPTENTISSSCGQLKRGSKITLGQPLSNVQIRILSAELQVQPIGLPGEIHIGGDQLSRGYLNLDELTLEKFIPDPFQPGGKLYKSGDVGRWLADGTIEFLGRNDDQIKIRGLRIELGDITHSIESIDEVHQAFVIVDEVNGEKQIVAYLLTEGEFRKDEIQKKLQSLLPSYMVPNIYISVDTFPLSQNGKIDRSELPVAEIHNSNSDYVEPASKTERELVSIWEELLRRDQVSTTDDFFELGGHSLLAVQMVNVIYERLGTKIKLHSIFEHKTIRGISTYLDSSANETFPDIDTKPVSVRTPLSYMQERIWFIDKIEGSVHYHIPLTLRLTGPVDIDRLCAAIKQVVLRHESLRTIITEIDGSGYQETIDGEQFQVVIIESEAHENGGLEQFLEEEFARPFDLSSDFMIRAQILSLGNKEHLLSLVLHHIAADGFSAPILTREIEEFYRDDSDHPANLLPLILQYSDYAFWQRSKQENLLKDQAAYWTEQLANVPPLDLPLDFSRPAIQQLQGENFYFTLSEEKLVRLKEFARSQGDTLFTVLLAIYVVLLKRYTSQEEICVGVPVSNREHPQLAPLIGFFVNTIAIKIPIRGGDPFEQVLKLVKHTLNRGYENQDMPFGKVVDLVSKTRDQSQTPIFQTMITLQEELDLPDLGEDVAISHFPFPMHSSKFDLEFDIISIDNGLTIRVEYCTALFQKETIERMSKHFLSLIDTALEDPLTQVDRLKMISQEEEHQLLREFNKTEVFEDFQETFLDIFQQQVNARPDSTAVLFEGKKLSYAELNAESNKLAIFLINSKVSEGDLIPLIMDRSDHFLISMIGIWKSGAAYVPIDPQYPLERITQILNTAEPKMILTVQHCLTKEVEQLTKDLGVALLIGNTPWKNMNGGHCPKRVESRELSYVIFTSGSTGVPKGAMIEHCGMLNHLKSKQDVLQLSENSVVAQNASQTFDISVWQFCAPLMVGGTTVVYKNDVILNPERFVTQLCQDEVNVLELVPSYLGLLLDQLDRNMLDSHLLQKIQYLMVTGEVLQPMLVNRWREYFKEVPVVNAYGPTEASDDITHYVITESQKGAVPIGLPIRNMRIYILNDANELCGVGIKGELCVSGIGVGRGYLKDEKKTNKAFFDDPFRSGYRMYKTGDIALIRSDEVIEFYGRKDDQVKIRGNRIELAEVEQAILKADKNLRGVVAVAKELEKETVLVAYLEVAHILDISDLRAQLLKRIPGYMIPDYFIPMDNFPLSSSGKVDRRMLPELDPNLVIATEIVPPSNDLERALISIWKDLLNPSSKIGIRNDFFELGGNSILAIKLVAQIREKLGLDIQLDKVFTASTIENQAVYLDLIQDLDQIENSEEIETIYI